MAFDYFAQQEVDIAIIETGLGGRLDSTNVITPEACLITNIGYDHMDLLGDTLEQIAKEKAGIIKNGVPVVIGTYQEEVFHVFVEKAKKEGARLFLDQSFGWSVYPPDYPYHKSLNRSSIRMLAHVLREYGWKLTDEDINQGFEDFEQLTELKGRYQVLNESPQIIADVSHNAEGLKILFNQVTSTLEGRSGMLHLIFGSVKGKDLEAIFGLFPTEARIYWTQSSVPRSIQVEELTGLGERYGFSGNVYPDVNEAIQQAKMVAQTEDIILITGSTFVVAEVEGL